MPINITAQASPPGALATAASTSVGAQENQARPYAARSIAPASDSVSTSTLASRLAKAERTAEQANAILSKSAPREKALAIPGFGIDSQERCESWSAPRTRPNAQWSSWRSLLYTLSTKLTRRIAPAIA